MAQLTFSTTGVNENPTKLVSKVRNFTVVVDEPEALGGTDSAPNPVEYILAGYAGCLNVVGHVIAKELGFELKKLSITIEGDLDPARFLGQSKSTRAGFQDIRVLLEPEAAVDQNTLDTWLKQVEDRCPVNDNLSNATPVSTSVKRLKKAA